MRADKVADIKWRIAQGTYVVNAELIAQRMLGSWHRVAGPFVLYG